MFISLSSPYKPVNNILYGLYNQQPQVKRVFIITCSPYIGHLLGQLLVDDQEDFSRNQ